MVTNGMCLGIMERVDATFSNNTEQRQTIKNLGKGYLRDFSCKYIRDCSYHRREMLFV